MKPYEREHFADPIMSFNRDPVSSIYFDHVFEVPRGRARRDRRRRRRLRMQLSDGGACARGRACARAPGDCLRAHALPGAVRAAPPPALAGVLPEDRADVMYTTTTAATSPSRAPRY